MLDPGTFSGTEAGKILAGILSNEPKLSKKITRMLSAYGRVHNELSKIDSRIAIGFENSYYKNLILYSDQYPSGIKTFLKNVIIAKHRKWMVQMDGHNAYKRRADYKGKMNENV